MCLIDLVFFVVATKKQFDDTVAIHPTSAEGKLMLFPLLVLALTPLFFSLKSLSLCAERNLLFK